jgi:hypothetical protein
LWRNRQNSFSEKISVLEEMLVVEGGQRGVRR